MEYFEKKITYLRGLCDGSGFSPESQEGKIFHGILDVLDDMAKALSNDCEEQNTQLISSDDEEEEYFLFSCICPQCGEEFDIAEETFRNEEEVFCPKCDNSIPIGAVNPDDLKF
jgi:predicted RNA-binding Zn-ribbon protein involved in translation (DUF1610 family)